MKYIQNLLAHKQLLLFLAVFWTILIGYLCLDESSDLPSISINNIDKSVHFSFHFVFTILWFFYFICNVNQINIIKYFAITFFMSLIYGIFIEWAQFYFTTNRKADVYDVIANVLGAIFALFASKYFIKNNRA